MTIVDKIRRRPLTDEERADRAEVKAFRPGFHRSGTARNRKSQLLLVLTLCASIVGGSLAAAGSLVGLVLFVVALPAFLAIAVWSFRNWDY